MSQRLKSSDAITAIIDRLTSHVSGVSIRTLVDADENPAYNLDEMIGIRFGKASPNPRSGAGRRAFKLERPVIVFVQTRCALDAGGDDSIAYGLHLDREDAIADALHDLPFDIGVILNWVDGPSEVKRMGKQHQSIFRSEITFQLLYCPPLRVTDTL